jgi:hypothetical protein
MSQATTIKVPIYVRDRLASVAKVRGITIRGLLDELSQRALDATLMEQAGQQMARMRDTDPDAWADYLHEGGEWEERTVERLDS